MLGAGLMMAHQVAGKAARDGLFLSRYPVSDLPKMIVGAALLAVLLGWMFTRLLSRYSPRKVVPIAILSSGILQCLEWFFLSHHPDLIVVLVYLHIVGFGAVLLSGFWSVANEVFDPREAKARFGRIAGMGTAGGITGGVLAERVVAQFDAASILLLLTILHLIAASLLFYLGSLNQTTPSESRGYSSEGSSSLEAFRKAPFLWSLATLVLLGTTSAALLDYLFKSGASIEFGKGEPLVRFFAAFYTGSQVLTFLVQTVLTRFSLEKLGLARTVMALPTTILAGSIGRLLVPTFPMITGVRSLELILRGSLFRSGYELFYTPIPAREKRSVKTIIDVGFDRLGDAVGAGVLQLLILLSVSSMDQYILIFSAGLAIISIWITTRMDKAYLRVLEQGLLNRAVELDVAEVQDSTTMSAVLRSLPITSLSGERIASVAEAGAAPLIQQSDPFWQKVQVFRSGDIRRVREELASIHQLDPFLVPHLIRLLAWDGVSEQVRDILIESGPRVIGQLCDILLDDSQDFTIRRRIPRILARIGGQRSVYGLESGLNDSRFEVRFQCGRALDYIHQTQHELKVEKDWILEVVEKELSVSRPIWQSRKFLDSRDTEDSFSFLDEAIRERTDQSLDHIFSLLALILPRAPLMTAFRALYSEDRLLHGLAMEYLESVIPERVRGKLIELRDAEPISTEIRNPQDILDQLMGSSQNLEREFRIPSGDVPLPDGKRSRATPESDPH